MKAVNIIIKIVAALAAIAGIVYVAATYGDKIVAWAKGLLNKLELLCNGCDCDCDECNCQCEGDCDDCPCEDDCDACPCECCCEASEEAAEEAVEEPAEDAAVAAEEADFEG